MMRPRKMKQIELTVLKWDVDKVIEYLGRRGIMHFSQEDARSNEGPLQAADTEAYKQIQDQLEKLKSAAAYLNIELPAEPEESTSLPGEAETKLSETICASIAAASKRENDEINEKRKTEEALTEARSFANLDAPFSELDQLSYLTLRIGRLDPKKQTSVKDALADRAIIIPLGEGGRVLAAASRKGRFALDSELKKQDFTPITIPEGYKGIPSELLTGLEERLETIDQELADIGEQKSALKKQYTKTLRDLTASYSMASAVEALKGQLRSTNSAYVLSGWVPADKVDTAVEDLEQLTGGRVAVLSYNPDEVEDVREGKEKVPVSLRHGSFVRGFEGVVFSYGAPLYGTIDPTPFVAFFFALLFGIMFGDLGQGFVLFLLGFLAGKHGLPFFARFRKYSTPLIAVGIASMVMGLLDGEVFANEHLLVQPTRAVTEFLTGKPMDRIISLMPEKGSIDKLFIFFGFTIAVGAILNSIGLVINIINQCSLKRYDKAFFAKTGLAGTFFFWYAIFIAVRIILGGHFFWADLIGLILPVALIFFGPALWRLISGQRPVLEHGFMVFFMEGFVEILETASTYVSNTVSFLRVGAFALSHAVLSFIVFTMIEMVSGIPGGSVFSLIVAVIGNGIIIVLEGMIVAIQVVRLQYYEFFSKFFTETGVEFNPFRFRKNMDEEAVRKSG